MRKISKQNRALQTARIVSQLKFVGAVVDEIEIAVPFHRDPWFGLPLFETSLNFADLNLLPFVILVADSDVSPHLAIETLRGTNLSLNFESQITFG